MRVICWQKGGQAVIETLQGDRITLCSTIASAPGSTLLGHLAVDPSMGLQVKIAQCKHVVAKGFTLTGRLINLTREERQKLDPFGELP